MEREEQALEEDAAEHVDETARAEIRRVAEALKVWRPELEEFVPEESRPWIDLTDENLQLQFSVGEGKVHIHMPYFREWVEEILAVVAESLRVMGEVAGYEAYDPQLERVVTSADVRAMAAQYRKVDVSVIAKGLAKAGKKPWWKFW